LYVAHVSVVPTGREKFIDGRGQRVFTYDDMVSLRETLED